MLRKSFSKSKKNWFLLVETEFPSLKSENIEWKKFFSQVWINNQNHQILEENQIQNKKTDNRTQ